MRCRGLCLVRDSFEYFGVDLFVERSGVFLVRVAEPLRLGGCVRLGGGERLISQL